MEPGADQRLRSDWLGLVVDECAGDINWFFRLDTDGEVFERRFTTERNDLSVCKSWLEPCQLKEA
jgi:hypothetical protein